MSDLTFEAPGPGPWQLDDSHFAVALPRYDRDRYTAAFRDGMRDGFEHYGMPMAAVVLEFVHGLAYLQMQPLVGSPAAKRLPPRFLFKLMMAVHPKLRARARRAEEVLRDHTWRDDVRRWGTGSGWGSTPARASPW